MTRTLGRAVPGAATGQYPVDWDREADVVVIGAGATNVSMILVGDTADAADDWIAERVGATDVCVTSDIPLASRCLKTGARVVSPIGKQWTEANIGNALAGREIAQHLRELGTITRGPAPLTKKDRSRFLGALDTALQAALREAARG